MYRRILYRALIRRLRQMHRSLPASWFIILSPLGLNDPWQYDQVQAAADQRLLQHRRLRRKNPDLRPLNDSILDDLYGL